MNPQYPVEDVEMNDELAVRLSRPSRRVILPPIFQRCWRQISAVAVVLVVVIIGLGVKAAWNSSGRVRTYYFNTELHSNELAYRIYVPGFQDSNGNGRGNVLGIRDRLSYFKQLNISLLWISSLQKTHDSDDDITNFSGTDLNLAYRDDESDWLQEFLNEAKKQGIKVIMDITINHSSIYHKWFIASQRNETRYKDYYIWHQGKMNGHQRKPPNNWQSDDGKSAWTWDNKRKAYYFHRSDETKPEINWENPQVREEMKSVIRYWLDKGFYGFYIQEFPYLLKKKKDFNEQFPPDDTSENIELSRMFQEVIRDWKKMNNIKKERVLLFSSTEQRMVFRKMEGISVGLVNDVLYQTKGDLQDVFLNNLMEETLDFAHYKDTFPVWILGNEKKSRIATKFGPNSAALLQQVQLMMPGLSVIYYGEEIGMTDLSNHISHCNDDGKSQERKLKKKDRFRSPMQWNKNHLAGFSNATSVCPPVNENFKEINVDVQMKNSSSLWNKIKELIQLRKYFEGFQVVKIGFPSVNERGLLAFTQKKPNSETGILVAMNVGGKSHNLTVEDFPGTLNNVTEFQQLTFYDSQIQIQPVDMESGIVIPPKNPIFITFRPE